MSNPAETGPDRGGEPAPRPVDVSEMADPGALIFDLDGTLVDTVEQRIVGWLRTFEEIGLPADRAHVAQLIGADGKRLAREVAAVSGREIDDDRAEAIDRRAGELYGEINTDPRPLAGVRPLLIALGRSDLPWAIATSSRAAQVMASVDALRLDRQPMIIDGSHVAHAKPAPDLLLLAAERLATSPRRCWYVGDATWDVMAARACGMPSVAIASGAVSADALAAAGATTVTTFEELAADLRRRSLIPAPA
jgi:HAD superfamily hydrolase (TIGR01509 family)